MAGSSPTSDSSLTSELLPNELLLVPTSMERDRLFAALSGEATDDHAKTVVQSMRRRTEVCGFGVAASGVLARHYIAQHRPARVILIGIAGGLHSDPDRQFEIGSAMWFDHVVCDGIGIGEPSRSRENGDSRENGGFLSSSQAGWQSIEATETFSAIDGRIELERPRITGSSALAGPSARSKASGHPSSNPSSQPTVIHRLVTVCAASSDPAMAADRLRRVSAADPVAMPVRSAEDMEGYSVALACHVAGVPLSILRGISNRAGDRDHASWQIDTALKSVARELLRLKDHH